MYGATAYDYDIDDVIDAKDLCVNKRFLKEPVWTDNGREKIKKLPPNTKILMG
jgi:hypothetical protein